MTLRSPRPLGLALLLALGCARPAVPLYAGAPARPEKEHVYLYPVTDALAAARDVLRRAGYVVGPSADGEGLLTRWKLNGPQEKVGTAQAAPTVLRRYYVQALALGPQHTVVRIFRIDRLEDGGEAATEEALAAEFAPRDERVDEGGWRAFVASGLEASDRAASASISGDSDTGERRSVIQSSGTSVRERLGRDTRFAGQYRMPTQDELRGRSEFGVRDLLFERALVERLEEFPSLEFTGGAHDLVPQRSEPGAASLTELWERQGDRTPFASDDACGEPVLGLEGLAAGPRTVLVGEQLGTREVPAAVGNLTCQLARGGKRVVLGLALPRAEQKALDAYVASEGTRGDQETLLAGGIWRQVPRDGRSSRALVGLLERVRRWRAAGLDVRPLAYDSDVLRGNDREISVAELLTAARAKDPEATLVVLGGNYHVRDVAAPWGTTFEPFGHRLVKAGVPVVALDTAFRRGTRWTCAQSPLKALECRVFATSPNELNYSPEGSGLALELFSERSPQGYHGLLHVGALTHSLPAMLPQRVGVAAAR